MVESFVFFSRGASGTPGASFFLSRCLENRERFSYLWDMRTTPDNIKAFIANQGYGALERAIKATYWDLYKAGYNRKEMKEAMSRQYGTEDEFIRAFIYFALNR